MRLRVDQPTIPEVPQPDQVIHPDNPAEVPAQPQPPEIPGEDMINKSAA